MGNARRNREDVEGEDVMNTAKLDKICDLLRVVEKESTDLLDNTLDQMQTRQVLRAMYLTATAREELSDVREI